MATKIVDNRVNFASVHKMCIRDRPDASCYIPSTHGDHHHAPRMESNLRIQKQSAVERRQHNQLDHRFRVTREITALHSISHCTLCIIQRSCHLADKSNRHIIFCLLYTSGFNTTETLAVLTLIRPSARVVYTL